MPAPVFQQMRPAAPEQLMCPRGPAKQVPPAAPQQCISAVKNYFNLSVLFCPTKGDQK